MRAVKQVKYFAVPRERRVVCTTQRAASVSMVESLAPMAGGNTHQIDAGVVMSLRKEGWRVLLWLRDPLERIACAYQVYGKRFVNVEMFIEHILNNRNPHWSPQIQLHTDGGIFLPTVVYPFEYLASTWAAELPGYPLQHLDASPDRLRWPDLDSRLSRYSVTRVLQHWAEDMAWRMFLAKSRQWQRVDDNVEKMQTP